MKKTDCIIVFVTVPDKKTANAIIKLILDEKLAACAGLSKKIDSFYWWKGKKERSQEFLLTIKTVKHKFTILSKKIRSVHPYEVPEIVSVKIDSGNKEYINWIKEYAG